MLDAARVRDHMEDVRAGLRSRGLEPDAELEQIATLETRRRRLIPEIEGLKREQNTAGDEIGSRQAAGARRVPGLCGEQGARPADPAARDSA